MLFVLIVHTDFLALGFPTPQDMAAAPGSVWAKIGFEFPALVCVNVFVLISGWFGIRASARGAMSFVFQCLYFGLLLYFVGCIDSGVLPNVLGIAQVLTLFKVNWFITAYLILYSFAPVLNGFAGNVGRRQLAMVTLVFFLMEFWMQFVSVAGFYSGGYSPIAFFGIYLLGRTMRVYSAELSRRSAGFYFWIYVVSTVCSGGLCGLFLMYGKPNMAYKMQFYNNPMIIVGAGALLLAFTRIRMPYNKGVNRIAKSTFAVFLLHLDVSWGFDTFLRSVRGIYSDFPEGMAVGPMALFIVAVFALAVLLDQPRIWMWRRISSEPKHRL